MITVDAILDSIVTYQDGVWSRHLKQISIREFLLLIKKEKYYNDIDRLRKYLGCDDKERYDQEKIRLPSVTFSGLFTESRKIDSLSKYYEICVIDIDNIINQNVQQTFYLLQSDPFIFSLWLSPSGRGIKGLVKFKYEKANPNQYENHKFAFSELYKYLREKYNIEIDKTGNDITRLCFISSDCNLVLKEQVEEFPINNQIIPPAFSTNTGRKNNSKSGIFERKNHLYPVGRNKHLKRLEIQKIIKCLQNRNLSITSTYENWYRVAYAISDTFTYDLGEKYFLQLCRLDGTKHNEDESKAMLQYCYENSRKSITFGTIQHYFNELQEVRGSCTEEASSNIDP
jgi:hypothetical protein